jgi:AbrB family looped-hinge helix DNA binding protein
MARIATRIDKAGRLVVPLELRRALRLEDGDEVELTLTAEGLMIRRVASEPDVTVEDGIPVVSLGGRTLSNDSVLDAIDQDRGLR